MLTPMLNNTYQIQQYQFVTLVNMQKYLLEILIFTSEQIIQMILIKLLVLTILLTVNIYVNTSKNQRPSTAIYSTIP